MKIQVVFGTFEKSEPKGTRYTYESHINDLKEGDTVMVPGSWVSNEPQVATVVSLTSDYNGSTQSIIGRVEVPSLAQETEYLRSRYPFTDPDKFVTINYHKKNHLMVDIQAEENSWPRNVFHCGRFGFSGSPYPYTRDRLPTDPKAWCPICYKELQRRLAS